MKFLIAVLAVLASIDCQQIGNFEEEEKPYITLKECTVDGGCTSTQAKLTLDANWRWLHSTSNTENCYENNQWNSDYCSNGNDCAKNCALEGVSLEKYSNTYGVKQIEDGVRLNFVTKDQYGTNVGSRLYVMDDASDKYKLFHLKNREFSFEVDVSELQCGMNGAMYFSEMADNGGKDKGNNNAGAKYGTGYCDAQCPRDIKFIEGEANVNDWDSESGTGKYGSCCVELDIWEANSMATAYTPHTCEKVGLYKCEGVKCGIGDNRYEGVCDKDGCDMNPYRMGNTGFYGPGPNYKVDTTKAMTVVTRFITKDGTDSGDLIEIRRFYVQDGNIIESPSSTILGKDEDSDSITDDFCAATKTLFKDVNDYEDLGGTKAMGESLDRGQVMVFSLWDDKDANMLWLDSTYPVNSKVGKPGVKRGSCSGGVESTPTFLRDNYPNAYVTFKNAAVGEIGSTVVVPDAEGCYSNNYKNCIPDDFDSESSSCNKIWLSNPTSKTCVALWGECTNETSNCCSPAECFGDDNYSTCVPPTLCTTCSNTGPKGKKCLEYGRKQLKKKCEKSKGWTRKNYCQFSCYEVGKGYKDDVCCAVSN